MKRTFKIALAVSKYIINTTKEKISKFKKEYENIVLKIPTYFKLLAKIYRYNGSSKRNSILN